MNRGPLHAAKAALFVALLALPIVGFGQDEEPAEDMQIEELGDDRYRVGNIIVDKDEQSFTLSGKILHLGKPLEYLAVKTDGAKGYESLLELETSANEFQLACILIGLDDTKSVKPRWQFDENEPEGQAVEISMHWTVDGEARSARAANALMAGEKPFGKHDWVYIGSGITPQGGLMAEASGTLIGFVHDPFAVIEHRTGAGIGAYGSIMGNSEILPPEGSAITLTVSVVSD